MIPSEQMRFVIENMQAHFPYSYGSPASEAEINGAQRRLHVIFPPSYRWFLSTFGSCFWPDYIFGLGEGLLPGQNVVNVTMRERTEVEPSLNEQLIAVSPDGWGNHYCVCTNDDPDDEGSVVLWKHELNSDQVLDPKYPSFLDFLEDLIREELQG